MNPKRKRGKDMWCFKYQCKCVDKEDKTECPNPCGHRITEAEIEKASEMKAKQILRNLVFSFTYIGGEQQIDQALRALKEMVLKLKKYDNHGRPLMTYNQAIDSIAGLFEEGVDDKRSLDSYGTYYRWDRMDIICLCDCSWILFKGENNEI